MRFTSSDNFRMISVRSNSLGGWAVYKSHDNPTCAAKDSSRVKDKASKASFDMSTVRS